MQDVKNIKNVNWGTVGSVAVGMAVFGLVVWGITKLPSNAITTPVKKAAAVVS